MKYNKPNINVCAIFATDLDGGMGYQGRMPWPHLSDDLKNFRRLTLGCHVLMGSKTWTSTDMKAPLPLRGNIVWSRNHSVLPNITDKVIQFTGDPKVCLEIFSDREPLASQIWVIGGAETLKTWMPFVNTVWHTEIHRRWECDTRYHNSYWQSEFTPEPNPSKYRDYDTGIEYTITVWNR